MNAIKWNADPKKRIFVIVMSKPQYQEFKYSDDAKQIYSSGNTAVVINSELPNNEIIRNMDNLGLVREGTMLMLSPYDSDFYQPIQDSLFEFSKRKVMLYSQYCQLLGATEVKVDVEEIVESTDQTEHHAAIKHKVAKLDAKVASEIKDKFKRSITSMGTFIGQFPDYSRATMFLKNKNLHADIMLCSLIEELQQSNQIRTKTIRFNTSTETTHQLKILGNLDIKPLKLGLSYDFTHITEKSYEIIVSLHVVFGDRC